MRLSSPRSLDEIMERLSASLPVLENRFGVKKIGVFGSYVRNEQKKKSDIDILVDLSKDARTFDNYMELRFFLEKQLGKKVDLGLEGSVRKEIAERVSKEIVYV